jgi:anti-sigma factor RsiW
MTNDARHPVDDLHELLDERLDPARRREVLAHVDACPDCRAELESLRSMQTVLRSELPDQAVPADLEAAVRAALDREPAPVQGAPAFRRRARAAAWVLAAAAVLLLALWATTRRPEGAPLVRDVVASGRAWRAPDVTPDHVTDDVRDLERYYAAQLPFGVTVYDLDAMGYVLLGGQVERVDDRQSAAFGYQGPDSKRVVCHMFLGSLDELPEGAERRTIDGRTFLVYRDGADTVVFWAEGRVICAFVGDLPVEDVVALAVAKASKAPAGS